VCAADACCGAGYSCCGFECIPTDIVPLGLPCLEVAGGCCPEPVENCCEAEAVCCDGMCIDAITAEDVLEVMLCGDLSCCEAGAALKPFYSTPSALLLFCRLLLLLCGLKPLIPMTVVRSDSSC
jgi:hypothetical protein